MGRGGTCFEGVGSSCVLAGAGSNSSIGPVTSWCNATDSYDHGNVTGVTWDCNPAPMVVSFNEPVGSTLSGSFSVDGPFEVWVLPSAKLCDLEGSLEDAASHVLYSCAPPVVYPPYSAWNLTSPHAGAVNLAALDFNFGASPGVLPADPWSLVIVDTSAGPETVHVGSALTVSASWFG